MSNATLVRMDERAALVKARDKAQERWESAQHAAVMARLNAESAESAYMAACHEVWEHDQQTRAQGVAK